MKESINLDVKGLENDNHQLHVDAHRQFQLLWNIPSGGYPLPHKDPTQYDMEAIRETMDQIQMDFSYILDKIKAITERIEVVNWCHISGIPTGCNAVKAGKLVLKVNHTDTCLQQHEEANKGIE